LASSVDLPPSTGIPLHLIPRSRITCRTLNGVRVGAVGGFVPDICVANREFAGLIGCTSDWIVRRTGIEERRRASSLLTTGDLCVEAGRDCIARSGVRTDDIDLLVLATCTPDTLMPGTGCAVQDRLGLKCPVVDLHGACAGFVYALVTAAAYISSGANELVLVVAGDTLSRGCDPSDPKTAVLFGDGAGAVLMGRSEREGTFAYALGTTGSAAALIRRETNGYLEMDGPAVFRWAVGVLSDTIPGVLAGSGLGIADVDLIIPHQANLRIIHAAAESLGVSPERFFTNLQRYGNTSAGSIPLALNEAVRAGRIKSGDLIVLSGFGSGLSWGTVVLRW
jgi:3-oxoacyl-[acyl-carrier-protein] synthase-3